MSLTESGSLDVAHWFFGGELKAKADMLRGYCDCYGHALMVPGRCEVMLDPVMNSWDCGALLPIVEEARGSAVSTNGLLFDEVMALSEWSSIE